MNKKYLIPMTLICSLTTALTPIITACNKNGEGGGDKPVVDYVVDLGQLFKGFERETPIISAEEEVTFVIEEATTDYLTYVKNEPHILTEDIYFAISDQAGVKDQPASGQLGIDISNVDPETEIIISQGGGMIHLPYKRIDATIVAGNLDFKVNSDGEIIHYQIDGYAIFKNLWVQLGYDDSAPSHRHWSINVLPSAEIYYSMLEHEGAASGVPNWSIDVDLSFKKSTGDLDPDEFVLDGIYNNKTDDEGLTFILTKIMSSFGLFLGNPIPLQFLTYVNPTSPETNEI